MESRALPPAGSPFKKLVLLGSVSLVLGLGYAYVLYRTQSAARGGASDGLAQPADSVTAFREVAPFELTDQDGRKFTREDLRGRAWIAGFVFTRCTGPCPVISSNMRALQDRLGDADVRLVTFSVDPEHDTPEVLRSYAASLGARLDRWTFLTGSTQSIQELSTKSFLLPVERDVTRPVGESVTHRTVLTVVDKRGVVRGYYDGESKPGLEQALARALFLSREGP